MFIDDDRLPTRDWVGTGYRLAKEDPACLWTGRVRPDGNPDAVPSMKDDRRPEDFSGTTRCEELYSNNMVVPSEAALALGGFDEVIAPAAEDCEFYYRWLRAGHPFRYVMYYEAGRPRWSDPRRGAIYGLLPGILAGWKATSRTAA